MAGEILTFIWKFSCIFPLFYLAAMWSLKVAWNGIRYTAKYMIWNLLPVFTAAVICLEHRICRGMPAAKAPLLYGAPSGIWENIQTPVFIIWLSGVWILALKYMFDYLQFRRRFCSMDKKRYGDHEELLMQCQKLTGMELNVDMYCHDLANVPFSFGILKHHIVLPFEVTESLDLVILHELVHCRRHDALRKAAVELLKICLWFHPFVYFYAKKSDELCEYACDEAVTKHMEFSRRKEYARAMIRYAPRYGYQNKKQPVFFSDAKDLKRRLEYILHPVQKQQKKALLALGAVFLLAGIAAGMGLYGFSGGGPSQIKTIRVNYPLGQAAEETYDYEEYMDGAWWRGTLAAGEVRAVTDRITEVTFSGEIYKCED